MKQLLTILTLVLFFTSCAGIPSPIIKTDCDPGMNVPQWSKMLEKWGTLEDMLKRRTAVKSTTADLQIKIKNQFGKTVYMLGAVGRFDPSQHIALLDYGSGEYRVSKEWVMDFLESSPIDTWVSVSLPVFACSDYSLALMSELNLSPWYGVMGGKAIISGHAINWFWPYDSEDIIFYEPQSDSIYKKEVNPILFIR